MRCINHERSGYCCSTFDILHLVFNVPTLRKGAIVMDNVIKIGEALGKRALRMKNGQVDEEMGQAKNVEAVTVDLAKIEEKLNSQKADLVKFSRDNLYTTYHDVIDVESFSPLMRRLPMTKGMRKDPSALIDALKSYKILKKTKKYCAFFYKDVNLFKIWDLGTDQAVCFVMVSGAPMVWDF